MINTLNHFITSLTILVLIIHIYLINKELKELKDDMWEVKYNRNHISRIEQGIIENGIRENKKLIEELTTSLDKKVEPIEQITHYSYAFGEKRQEHTKVLGYKIVDLTDKEKTINKIRELADELEAQKDCPLLNEYRKLVGA